MKVSDLFVLFAAFSCVSQLAFAESLLWSSDREVKSKDQNRVELYGHAHASQGSQTLEADSMLINLKGGTINADGNCVYREDGQPISHECHFLISKGKWRNWPRKQSSKRNS